MHRRPRGEAGGVRRNSPRRAHSRDVQDRVADKCSSTTLQEATGHLVDSQRDDEATRAHSAVRATLAAFLAVVAGCRVMGLAQ